MKKTIPITPAAIGALKAGDMDNFLVATTPGGIERQEAEGQRALCASQQLPKEIRGVAREQLQAVGFKFGADVDDLFVSAVLPAGWSLKPTEHSMHNDLVDDKGRPRAGLFYKAAFYDRKASLTFATRFNYQAFADGSKDRHYAVVVKDGDTVIHRVGEWRAGLFEECTRLEELAKEWLQENRPQWRDPLAYWD